MMKTLNLIPVVALLASACASAPAPVVMTGTVVRPEVDPLVGLDHYDARTLFHLAADTARDGDRARATALYERLLEEFPGDIVEAAARFNLGLLYEDQRRWHDALAQYESITARTLPVDDHERRTWIDAHYRQAVCFGRVDEWWRAVALFEKLEAFDWLREEDRLEALVGKGIALQEAGEPEAAELSFSHALRYYRVVSQRRRFDDRGLAAEAAFRMGDISRERFATVTLEYPVPVLSERLDAKCQELLNAQNRYLQAIRYGDNHTVAAAGFRIGSLYETLYAEMMALEIPEELDREQAEVYLEEVHAKVGVLLEKAIKIYEKSLVAGRRTETASDWVERTEAALARLRAIYLARAPEGT